MFKGILIATALVFGAATAQAEVVALKTKHIYESSKGSKEISFSVKACGLKAIAFKVEGKHNSYVSYSSATASYKIDSAWGVSRDQFNTYGMIMAGEISPWFELSGKQPCLRKVYLQAETNLWPTSELAITVLGEK